MFLSHIVNYHLIIKFIESSKLDALRNQQNGSIPFIIEHNSSSQNIDSSSIDTNSTTVVDSSTLKNESPPRNNISGNALETYETFGIESDNLEGKSTRCYYIICIRDKTYLKVILCCSKKTAIFSCFIFRS